MLNTIRKAFMFALGRKASKKAARAFGLKTLAPVIGLIGGLKAMKR